MKTLTNVELRGIGLKSFLNKEVVVKYSDEQRQGIAVTTGILTDFNEGEYDDDGDLIEKGYIVLSSETDYDRISLGNVTKIFLKEDNLPVITKVYPKKE